ncbi:MAG: 1-acyl-sn-glycerol-3-phosphate acyltransferase [Candidatus Kerfeldbacteria bacterium]|nr:1-acyl-sn-glycerol-3-phosphate acyltransferase [Candidatus Kerfeldbacteria bacterium]
MNDFAFLRHTLVPLFRRRVQVRNADRLPQTGAFLVAVNHQSYLDPPLVWLGLTPILKRRLYFLTKEYIWRALKRGFGQRGIDWMGILPIDTSDKAKVLDAALAKLAVGAPVVVFPEGTRNRTGEPVLLKGRTGLARLAHATGLPVVPIGLVAPAGRNKRMAFKNFFSRQAAILTVGEPLHFEQRRDVGKDQLVATTTEVMRAIGTLCGKEYPF